MKIDKLDKILMSKEDLDNLFKWRDNHKEYVRNFKSTLKEGVIKIGDFHEQSFHDMGDHYLYVVYNKGKKIHEVEWDKATKIGRTKFTLLEGVDEFEYNQDIISLHASLMAYMEYYSDKKEYVEIETVQETVVKERKYKKKYKRTPVKIERKVYKVNINKEATVRDKRRYERVMSKWTVRGHWRHLKTGKKVWVRPHVKGSGKEINPKDYKL